MKVTVTGMVLRSPVRHNDRTDILTVYTPTHGRLSVAIGAGGGKSGRQRRAATMPLSLVEFQVTDRSTERLQRASSLAALSAYRTIYFDPVKSMLAMFMAEFLNKLLRDASPDPTMYRYIADSAALLDAVDDRRMLPNFHIAFLAGLTAFAGISPDTSGYHKDALFDMVSGRYATLPPPHRAVLSGDRVRIPLILKRMTFANQHLFRFTRLQRREVLDGLLRYFGLHFPGTDNLSSPQILSEILS